ncbi:MFS transporter [Simkania sp.]|uniref:MFS transporter n=1 Tax=Simkania sp. TaxID=34094 RepID=UPI003B52512C
MRKVIRSVTPPLVSLVIVMLGNGFFNTYASLRIAFEGYSNIIIGILNAAYYTGVMLGSIYVERLIDRIGHIRTFAMFASINSAVILVQSFIIGPVSWTFFRFLVGFCASGFFIVIESWLLLSTGIRTRGKILSLYMLTLYMAQGFGQFILNAAPMKSFLPFAITIFLSSVSVLPVCMMKSSGPLMLESSITNIFQILKKAPLGPIGCFIAGLIMSSFYGLGPIFGKEVNLSIMQISQIMGLTILGGLALQWPIGHLSDIFNRRKVIIGVFLALMLLTFALFHSHNFPYYLLLTLMVLFGGISFTIYPLSITYTCDYFSERNIVGITCALLIIYGTGCIVGPLISPLFMSLVGPSGLFLFIALVSAVYIVFAMWRFLHARRPAEEEQSDYLPLPRATSLAFLLDPRSDMGSDEIEGEEDEDLYPFMEEDEDEEED